MRPSPYTPLEEADRWWSFLRTYYPEPNTLAAKWTNSLWDMRLAAPPVRVILWDATLWMPSNPNLPVAAILKRDWQQYPESRAKLSSGGVYCDAFLLSADRRILAHVHGSPVDEDSNSFGLIGERVRSMIGDSEHVTCLVGRLQDEPHCRKHVWVWGQ